MANTFKNSIYDKTSYNKALDPKKLGQYGITFNVNPNGGTNDADKPVAITGILNKAISWGVKAEWEQKNLLGALNALVPVGGLLADLDTAFDLYSEYAGRSIENSGLFTRKFYKSSGDLTLNPSFRVFDFKNEGLPISAGLIFTSLCLPKRKDSASFAAGGTIQKVGTNGSNLAGVGVDTVVAAGFVSTDTGNSIKTGVNDSVQTLTQNFGDTRINWTTQPATVDVKIGAWLKISAMVLTNVSVSYSMEMTNNGPLYADFDLTLVTRENLTFNDNGEIDQIDLTLNNEENQTPQFNTSKPPVSFGHVG